MSAAVVDAPRRGAADAEDGGEEAAEAHRRPIVADAARESSRTFKRYAIGPFELDAARSVLTLAGEPLALGPRVVETLTALVERPGEVVTKDELLDRVWAGEDVNESNVAQSVYTLRKMLREHGLGDAIATVPRRGYRFTAPVELARRSRPSGRFRSGARAGRSASRWLAPAAVAVLRSSRSSPARAGAPHDRHAPRAPLSARGASCTDSAATTGTCARRRGSRRARDLFAAVVASDPRNPLGHAGAGRRLIS